jgi:hypothetical protein
MVHLQLVAVLPDIIQTNDVGMVQQLHDADLALQAEGDELAVRHRRLLLSALDEVGQADSPHLLRHRLRDDLSGTILSSPAVPHEPHTRAATPSDGPAELPRANVGLAAAVGAGSVRARGRDLRVALRVMWAALVGLDG